MLSEREKVEATDRKIQEINQRTWYGGRRVIAGGVTLAALAAIAVSAWLGAPMGAIFAFAVIGIIFAGVTAAFATEVNREEEVDGVKHGDPSRTSPHGAK